MRNIKTLGFALLCVAPLLAMAEQAQAEARLWAAGSTEKIQDRNRSPLPHDSVWNEETKTVTVDGVRGEFVPFHAVVTTDNKTLAGINFEASDLRSGDNVLPAEQVEFFYEHLSKIYAPSGRHGKRGFWPDALVPLTRPFRIKARPDYMHMSSINQPIWVEAKVPHNQPPGEYTGTITVTSNEGEVGTINVKLTVWDLELPKQRSYPLNIGIYEKHVARVHGVDRESPEFRELSMNYSRFFLEQGIDPRINPGLQGEVVNGNYVLTCKDPELERMFLDMGRRRFYVYPTPIGMRRPKRGEAFTEQYKMFIRQHCEQVIARAKQQGWYDRLIFHIQVDEPRRQAGYDSIRYWAEVVRPIDPNVPLAVTEQPQPENPAWGSLVGSASAWIINGNNLYNEPDSIADRKNAGEDSIWYISCDQLYPQPNVFIDREAADCRMVAWLTSRYNLDGFLYWNAAYWAETLDPWTDACTWKKMDCNAPASGEGSLIYPGHLVNKFTGQANVNGPIGSIRLAMFREGFEELELIKMLREQGGEREADEITESICRDLRDFSRDPNAIDSARARLIQELLKRKQP